MAKQKRPRSTLPGRQKGNGLGREERENAEGNIEKVIRENIEPSINLRILLSSLILRPSI
jgi:hypothetical protein